MHKIVNGIEVELTPEEEKEVIAQWESDTAHFAKTEYISKRAVAYPPVEEQLDMLYKAMDAGEIPKATAWYNSIKEVKLEYPKPSEEKVK